jgi:SAM-dependent methyltransferase
MIVPSYAQSGNPGIPEEKDSGIHETGGSVQKPDNDRPRRDEVIRRYLLTETSKLTALGEIARICVTNGYNSVLSLGSGSGINEFFLFQMLDGNVSILATDIDWEQISTGKNLFPQIHIEQFDFKAGSVKEFLEERGTIPDVVVFMNSSYVLDDAEFIRLFSELSKTGVKMVLDLTTACRPAHIIIRKIIFQNIRFLLYERRSKGTMHGYERDWCHMKRLYRKSGYNIMSDHTVGHYPHFVQLMPESTLGAEL